KKLKRGPIGNTIIFKLKNYKLKGSSKNEHKYYVLNVVVMQPSVEGYLECPHQLNPMQPWTLSGAIREDIFSESLVKGMFFRTTYDTPNDERNFIDFISLELRHFQEVHKSFHDML